MNKSLHKAIRRGLGKLMGATLILLVLGCTSGVQSGSITASFSGINTATVISPTTVKVTWTQSDVYKFYDIYADYQKDPIVKDQIFGEVLVENLTPGKTYKFKVLGKGSTVGAGNDRQIEVKMWDRFAGISKTTKDGDGFIEVSWDYDQQPQEYYIFVGEESTPTEQSTNGWTNPDVTTTAKKHLFKKLKGSTNYYFVVQAKYRQGEFERNTKALMEASNSTFGARDSWVSVPRITIGALPSFQVTIPPNPLFPVKNYTTRIYKDGQIISDPLVGSGKIAFSSGVNFDLGNITGITTKINYKDATKGIDETYTIPNQQTYLKGLVPQLDLPPGTGTSDTAELGPAFLGKSMARGDFNCDGFDDLAIGMPDGVIGSTGSTNPNQGAIYVYYGGQKKGDRYYLRTSSKLPQTRQGVVTPDPQLITFPDLSTDSFFGWAMAAGNLNRDRNGNFECDDLAVGAPGYGAEGSVVLFFGSKSGIKYPNSASALTINAPTCDGLGENATCTPVLITPDTSRWPTAAFGNKAYSPRAPSGYYYDHQSFGKAIAFIGDFDANGFGDLAIGAPNAPWDGDLIDLNLIGINTVSVGYVALFFGSANGLGMVAPSSSTTEKFRFVKIYPPIAQNNMYFGSSIAGNADVDGRNRLILPDNSYAGGPDMIIGAPGFIYSDPAQSRDYPLDFTNQSSKAIDAKVVSLYPGEHGWWRNTGAYNDPFSLGSKATGIAFLYFGRTATDTDEDTFWACGRRGSTLNTHFSCLTDRANFRLIFPRDTESGSTNKAFGSSVALLGSPSARDSADALLCDPYASPPRKICRDPNGDGYAEIIVGAPNSSNSAKANMGALWEFFGNKERRFEYGSSISDQFGATYPVTVPTCTGFVSPVNTAISDATKTLCAPTRLRSSSMPAGTQLGLYASSMAVGDINRDGLLDVVVGGPAYNPDGLQPLTGAVFMFPSARGVGITTNYATFSKTSPDVYRRGYDRLGWSVVVGDFDSASDSGRLDDFAYLPSLTNIDLNMLSYNDVVAGAPYDDVDRNAGGAIHFFYSGGNVGNPSTLPSTIATDKNMNADPFEILVDKATSLQGTGFGYTKSVGDVNGDGFEDAVGAVKGYDNQGNITFTGTVFFGSPIGLITTQYCIDHANKVFLSGDTPTNRTYCQPAITHPIGITQQGIILPQLMRTPNNLGNTWATHAYAAGDVNGDGFNDVLFIDPYRSPDWIVLYFGSRSGLLDMVVPSINPSNSDPQIVTKAIDLIGYYSPYSGYYNYNVDFRFNSQIVFGDFNKDGYSDVVFSNPLTRGPQLNSPTTTSDGQTVPKFAGTPSDGTWICPDAATNPLRPSACITGAGPDYHGAAWVFYGSANGLQTPLRATNSDVSDSNSFVVNLYDSVKEKAKRSCDSTTGICKVGKIRNPVYFNINQGFSQMGHFFGSSMTVMNYNASASGLLPQEDSGDYDDLLIAAPNYQNPGCVYQGAAAKEGNQGRIFLYAGSKDGLVAQTFNDYWPSDDSKGELLICDIGNFSDRETGLGYELDPNKRLNALRMPIVMEFPTGNTKVSSGNASTRGFARKIVAVGDLNGDGQEDLAVSAPDENVRADGSIITGAGAVYVYYGPFCPADNNREVLNGIQESELGQPTYAINKQKQFSDFQLGKEWTGSCGTKTLAPQKIVIRDAAKNSHYGYSIIGRRLAKGINKSDINGEKQFPLSDIIVGTPFYDDVTTATSDIGRGVVLFGSAPNGDYPGGLFADDYPSYVVETISGTKLKPYILQMPKIPNINFFWLNGSTGDFNNDGSMDVIIPTNEYDIPPSAGGPGGINVGALLLFF